MENKNLLENYREQINNLDKELIYLFFRRFKIVKQIGEFKKQNGISSLDKNRWNELLNINLEIAKDFGLNEKFLIDIWERIHIESLDLEK